MRTTLATAALAAALLAPAAGLAAERTVTLEVPGMSCASCPYIVSRALKGVDGVKSVEASLAEKRAVVVYDDAVTDLASLTKATAAVGFESSPAR